jgi:hypothetical protein
MRYRWAKRGNEWEEMWTLYLILDGKKYGFADVNWYFDMERWGVFVSGFVCEEKAHVERPYELLCDAKNDVLDYAKVWWVSGALQRMNEDEKRQWREMATP